MVNKQVGLGDAGRTRAVIFDFDGTISDSFEYVFDFLHKAAGSHREFSAAEKKELRKMSMKRLALHLGVPVWKLVGTYFKGRRVMRAHMEQVKPFPGMVEAIQELHQKGHSLFVVSSNSVHNIRFLLRHYGIEQYFRAVQGGAGYTGKSSLIRRVRLRYRLSKQTTWYVGDETNDVVAATWAGIPCIAVTWGFADPDALREVGPVALAEHPADILKIVEGTWKR
jgi:phosphoglycolate phosphatase